MRIIRCQACYFGYANHPKQRIPRGFKKLIKEACDYLGVYDRDFFRGGVFDFDLCNLKEQIKAAEPYFKLIPFFKKYRESIELIMKVASEHEPCIVEFEDNNFRFAFTWEHDNGLYTESDAMKFIYKKSEFNETWSGDETKNLLECFDIPFESVTSDLELIKFVHSMSDEKKKQIRQEYISDSDLPW